MCHLLLLPLTGFGQRWVINPCASVKCVFPTLARRKCPPSTKQPRAWERKCSPPGALSGFRALQKARQKRNSQQCVFCGVVKLMFLGGRCLAHESLQPCGLSEFLLLFPLLLFPCPLEQERSSFQVLYCFYFKP